jgi:enoyl-CoA hydratase/carnithine racemase
MTLVTTDDRGAVRVITYANPPFGTMTGAGSSEMFDAMTAAARDGAVRVIVITGGMPGVFIRHYDVGELSQMADAAQNAPVSAPASPKPGSTTTGFPFANRPDRGSREAGHRGDQRAVHGRRLRAFAGL